MWFRPVFPVSDFADHHKKNSVVFASAYRFSVLFSYTGTDPTYTLAPTVGWTAIEMSAGIVSACLPTLRPVIQWAARAVGIKGGIFGSSEHDSAAFSKNLDKSSGNRLRSDPGGASDADFYRLPGDDGPGAGAGLSSGKMMMSKEQQLAAAADAALRPDHGFGYAVATSTSVHAKGDKDSLSSGDEIPLQGIRVHKDFKRSG